MEHHVPTPLAMPQQRPPLEPVTFSELAAAMHRALERAVYRARLEGASWADVARALGVSRQAARKRWIYLDGLGDLVEVRTHQLDDGTVVAGFLATGLGGVELDHSADGRRAALRELVHAGKRLGPGLTALPASQSPAAGASGAAGRRAL